MKNHVMKILMVGIFLFVGCSQDQAGATSETTNGVAAVVVLTDGTPVAGADVYLRESQSVRHPDDSEDMPIVSTNSDGKFFIVDTLIPTGEYTVEIRDTTEGLVAVQEGVLVDPTTIIQKDTLVAQKTGTLVGSLADSDTMLLNGSYVQVQGLGRAVYVDSVTGHFEIVDLPVGGVRINVVVSDTLYVADADSFTIKENRVTDAGIYQPGLEKELAIVTQLLAANNLPTDMDFLFKVIVIKDNHIREINLDSTYLREINLDSWLIDTLIPEVGDLRVHSLSLAGNDLTSLPDEIGNLVELYYLDVSSNSLTSLPEGIGNMVECNEIDIENNDIENLPETIYQLEELETIRVAYNGLVDLTNKMRSWINQHASQDDWEDFQTPIP